MTLDEAIEHAREVERTCEDTRCAAEHSQLAEWLCELRQVRIDIEVLKIFRDGFKEDAQKYKFENAKLRKYAELYAGVVKAGGCDLCPYCEDFEACEDAEAVSMSDGCALYMEMRELGIEVD